MTCHGEEIDQKKLIKGIGLETVFDHAFKSHLENFYGFPSMAFISIKIEDIFSLQVFSVTLISLSIAAETSC